MEFHTELVHYALINVACSSDRTEAGCCLQKSVTRPQIIRQYSSQSNLGEADVGDRVL